MTKGKETGQLGVDAIIFVFASYVFWTCFLALVLTDTDALLNILSGWLACAFTVATVMITFGAISRDTKKSLAVLALVLVTRRHSSLAGLCFVSESVYVVAAP